IPGRHVASQRPIPTTLGTVSKFLIGSELCLLHQKHRRVMAHYFRQTAFFLYMRYLDSDLRYVLLE
ncbi:MAG: hypothetical protein AAGM67_10665, partial [Bacteroidota bacterium]